MSEDKIVKIQKFKKTKIIATIGPSTNTYAWIKEVIKTGANGLRLNFSHGTHEERIDQIKWIRKASDELNKPVAIIQDIQGPKIRLGDFDGVVTVQEGQTLALKYDADYERSGYLPTQYDLTKKVKRGERVLLYDGKIKTIVTSVKEGVVYVRAENEGILIKRKGINLPDTDFGGDVITTKDKQDLSFGSTVGIDYVALSFVQTAKDVEKLRKILKNLGSKAKIIAKIETAAALDNLEEIIDAADVVMVARGDLAIETLHETVPVVQRNIIRLGIKHRKPIIVATHMMASMMDSPEPTRAEVSDVATAVLVGADCVMLSDETAAGKYPIEAIKMMKRIILHTEENEQLKVKHKFDSEVVPNKQQAICEAIINLAETVNAIAIVAETASGSTAIEISARRPSSPIIAVTADKLVANQLSIIFGIKSYLRPLDPKAATKLTNWMQSTKILKKGDIVVTASGKYPGVVGATDTIKIRMMD
jgi:pyruvate kinase